MRESYNRREFLHRAAGYGAIATGLSFSAYAAGAAIKMLPVVPDHTLTTIAGKPRERGRQYGKKFGQAMAAFRDKEIYCFAANPPSRDDLLYYAGQCGKAIKDYAPTIMDELEGIAEGSGIRLEEVVLISLHEELYHKGVLPPVEHCTALAAGPPDTKDGKTYVGQNWDWMESVYGLSSVLLWKRPEGPSLLAYAYPGLWVGAGLNSAGIALCWTSAESMGIKGPRAGIPSYVLIAQMLYQETLKEAIAEARRAKQAGWFTFVLADGKGQLANVEGTPDKLVVEMDHGHLARTYCGTREMTGTPKDQPVKYHPQCQRMYELLEGSKGKLDRPTLQGFFGDHKSTICKHNGTLDSMLFDCTSRKAYVSRGPGCSGRWKEFGFQT